MSDFEATMPHADHRKRMRERFEKNGIFTFKEHEILEMILFYSQPRRNTNDLSHDLLRKFGNLRGVFSADPQELQRVDGIGKATADLISMLGEIMLKITLDSVDVIAMNTEDRIGSFASMVMGTACSGSVLAVYLDKNGIRIKEELLSRGKPKDGTVDYDRVVKSVGELSAKGLIIIHEHRHEPIEPSPDDCVMTDSCAEEIKAAGVKNIYQVIVSDSGYTFI